MCTPNYNIIFRFCGGKFGLVDLLSSFAVFGRVPCGRAKKRNPNKNERQSFKSSKTFALHTLERKMQFPHTQNENVVTKRGKSCQFAFDGIQ